MVAGAFVRGVRGDGIERRAEPCGLPLKRGHRHESDPAALRNETLGTPGSKDP